MKKIWQVPVYALLTVLALNAQAPQPPQALNYQAIARDSAGNTLPNRVIGLRFSILDNSATGTVLYTETFTDTTNLFGLFSVDIGTGTPVAGTFNAINWAVGTKWLKVETDVTGGNNYSLMGTSQFLSVPYALYAANSGFSYAQNTTTSVSPVGDTVYIGNTFVIVPGTSMANACRMDFIDTVPYTIGHPHSGDQFYNTALYGLPKFILKDYIELDKIDSISRFRSGAGHDYSDSYEACRSMKHYYRPRMNIDWTTIKIFSPVNGVVVDTLNEWTGTQILIRPFGMPAFWITIFHVNITPALSPGDTVWSGQHIGYHSSNQTGSDIAIQMSDVNSTWRKVSYFDLMTDKLFACYMSRGVMTRDTLIISKTARDADPLLPCNGNQFFYQGTIDNWVTLH